MPEERARNVSTPQGFFMLRNTLIPHEGIIFRSAISETSGDAGKAVKKIQRPVKNKVKKGGVDSTCGAK